jgi:hypothetical protein
VNVTEIRAAVEAKDLDRMVAGLSPDVVVHSPVAYRPFHGVDAARVLFRAILDTYQDFRYREELHGEHSAALIFDTRIGDRETQGLHHLRFGPDGQVDEVTVMVRPLSAAQAFAEVIGPKVMAALAAAPDRPEA